MMLETRTTNVLLVGGAGFLGINTSISLQHAGFQVYILDRSCEHLKGMQPLNGVAGFFDGDAADGALILDIAQRFSIGCVVNLVSLLIPSSNYERFEQEMAGCTLPAFQLIPQLAARGIKYVYFSSGGAIYGRTGSELIAESTECRPISLYGYAKLIFEEYLGFCARAHGLEYLIVRPSNPYGRFQNPTRMQGFIAVCMDRILKDEEIEIWGDGSVVRDYILVSDMTAAFASLLAKGPGNGAFNLGSGVGHSLNDVLGMLETVTQRQARVRYMPPRSVDVERMVLDVSKLKSEIEFAPHSLRNGLEIFFDQLVNKDAE